MKYCCKDIKEAIKLDYITQLPPNKFYLLKTHLVNDGGCYYDEMPEEYEIFYCPFCGKRLNES